MAAKVSSNLATGYSPSNIATGEGTVLQDIINSISNIKDVNVNATFQTKSEEIPESKKPKLVIIRNKNPPPISTTPSDQQDDLMVEGPKFFDTPTPIKPTKSLTDIATSPKRSQNIFTAKRVNLPEASTTVRKVKTRSLASPQRQGVLINFTNEQIKSLSKIDKLQESLNEKK